MSRLIASILVVLALHGGLHPRSPLPAAGGGHGFGAYVRDLTAGAGVAQPIRFGEAIPRPPATLVAQGW